MKLLKADSILYYTNLDVKITTQKITLLESHYWYDN
jgi:hypothetical protein